MKNRMRDDLTPAQESLVGCYERLVATLREHRGSLAPFEERNAQDNLAYRKEMFSYTGGDPVVPVIVVDGVYKQSGWEGRG